ncbi:hypothetical protein [Bacillus thuringiensis]|uniref:hypothetical protein n=1 Tax=Bacillus thuringiensis TaxID=1428 RepID=UPI0011A5E023|nr:hypothetical protein [Bacillus thuringiensis]
MSSIFKRGWINMSIDMGLNSFDNYINEMEDFLSNQVNKLEKQFNEAIKDIDSHEAEIIFEYEYEDQFFYFRKEFPNILRKSFIISLYSFLEQELNHICKHLEENNEFELTLNDLKSHTGIFKSYKYLDQVAKINLNTFKSEWTKILKINKIRNHFVHNGSDMLNKVIQPMGKEEQRINTTCTAFKYFNLVEEDKTYTKFRESINDRRILIYDITVSNDFCKEALSIVKDFFDKLTNMLKLY